MIVWGAVGIIVTALAVWYVAAPLFVPEESMASSEPSEGLEKQYHRTLQTILELEADYETGKLSRRDYETAVSRLKLRAAEILREMDRHADQYSVNHGTMVTIQPSDGGTLITPDSCSVIPNRGEQSEPR